MTYLTKIKQPDPQKTANGKTHGLLKVMANSVEFDDYKRFPESKREEMKKMHKEQSKLVKALYVRTKNSTQLFPYQYLQWDGEPILQYAFLHNHEYEVPQGLVDEVNSRIPMKRSGLLDSSGTKYLQTDEQEEPEHRFIVIGKVA